MTVKTAQHTVTLSKGGLKERTVPINQLQIPDLWHIAQWIRKEDPNSADKILECWYIAHDLRRELCEHYDTQDELLEAAKLGLRAMRSLGWPEATGLQLQQWYETAFNAVQKAEGSAQ